MFNANTEATRRKNARCLEAVKLKADGLSFREIAAHFSTTPDPARSLVARGVRLIATEADMAAADDSWISAPAVLRARGAV